MKNLTPDDPVLLGRRVNSDPSARFVLADLPLGCVRFEALAIAFDPIVNTTGNTFINGSLRCFYICLRIDIDYDKVVVRSAKRDPQVANAGILRPATSTHLRGADHPPIGRCARRSVAAATPRRRSRVCGFARRLVGRLCFTPIGT